MVGLYFNYIILFFGEWIMLFGIIICIVSRYGFGDFDEGVGVLFVVFVKVELDE